LKQRNYILLLIIVLAAVLLFPGQAFAAGLGEKIYSFKGEPVFNPAVGKDGNISIGFYQPLFNDENPFQPFTFATISPEGEQLKNWQERGLPIHTFDAENKDLLYVTDHKNKLKAFDQNHEKKWEKTLEPDSWISFLDSRGHAYIDLEDKKGNQSLIKYAPTGKTVQYPAASWTEFNFSEDGTFAYQLAPGKDPLQAVLRGLKENGKIAWQTAPFKKTKTYQKKTYQLEDFTIEAVDAKGNVYLTASYGEKRYTDLYAFNSNGKRLWKKDLGKGNAFQIKVVDKTLIYENGDTRISFVNVTDGKTIRTAKLTYREPEAISLIAGPETFFAVDAAGIHTYSSQGKKLGTYPFPNGDRLEYYSLDETGRLYAVISGLKKGKPYQGVAAISDQGKLLSEVIYQGKASISGIAAHPHSGEWYMFQTLYGKTRAEQTEVWKYNSSK